MAADPLHFLNPSIPWKSPRNYPVRIQLTILDAMDQVVWRLAYRTLRRTVVDYPSEQPLFYQKGGGFGDFGYHELSDAGSGFLQHEILFASGASLLFEFANVEIFSMPRSEATSLQQWFT